MRLRILRPPPLLLLPPLPPPLLLMSVVTLPSKVVSKVLSRQRRRQRDERIKAHCDPHVGKREAPLPNIKKNKTGTS